MSDDFNLMKPEVFEGATGLLVICQEWPSLVRGEEYLRIMIPMSEARELAAAILMAADRAERKETARRESNS